MSYAKTKTLRERTSEAAGSDGGQKRTYYRCAAPGCPNAGCIDDRGAENPGKCYFHWSTPSSDWGRITAQIKADPGMRNHGLVPVKSSGWVEQARAAGHRRQGLRVGSGSQEAVMYGEQEAA